MHFQIAILVTWKILPVCCSSAKLAGLLPSGSRHDMSAYFNR